VGRNGTRLKLLESGNEMSTILIADEDLLIHILVRMAMDSSTDTFFLEAKNMDEAVKLAREQGPVDLLLCDIATPGELSAMEFVTQFSTIHPASKVLMMSSQDVPVLPQNPSWHNILKPFRPEEVRRKIELALGTTPSAVRSTEMPSTSSKPSVDLSAENSPIVYPDVREDPPQ
jgi:DNA-binding NtrC family response regulator